MSVKKPPKVPKSAKNRPGPPPPAPVATPSKKFTVKSWGNSNAGEKIIIYGDTGLGKTTLATTAPKPVFLGLDKGEGKLVNPITGEPPMFVPDVETFADVRSALQQIDLYDDFKTIVIDNATILQDWAEPYVVATIPTDKGAYVKNLLGYGYNKGYKHLYNVMKGPLQDCDELVRRGKNVIMIAQSLPHRVSNPGGEDFLRDGPRLHIDKTWSIEALYCEWADHILRIDYFNSFVSKDKKISGDTTRAIYIQPEVHFRAKSRTINEPVLTFEEPADDTAWQFIFKMKEGE